MRRTRHARHTRKATAAERARSLELLVAALLGASSARGVPISSDRPSPTGRLSHADGAPRQQSSHTKRPANQQ